MAVTTLNRSEQIRKTSNHNSVSYNDGTGTLTDGTTLTWDGTSLGVGANITANSSTGAISATSATLTNALPVTSGGTGTTTSTGTGSVVLSTSPTLVTPALGTPSSLVLTNAIGTPTSIGLANGTGLPLTTGVTGTLPIANGGTNSNTSLANGFVIGSSGGKIVENPSTNALSMNGGRLTNLADPVSSQDATTKNYVDMAVNGLTWKSPVAAATTTVLPFSPTYANGSSGVGATLTAGSNGVLTVDGYTVLLNDRILVQNQASAFQNGIYTVTTLGTVSVPYVLTRATDSNTPADLQAGTATFATNGTTNADKGFLQTTTGTITIGTTNLVYTTFTSAVSSYVAGNGLDLTGNIFSISTDDTLTAFAGGSSPSLIVNISGRTAGGILFDTDDSTGLHEDANITYDGSRFLLNNGVSLFVASGGTVTFDNAPVALQDGSSINMTGGGNITLDTGNVQTVSGIVEAPTFIVASGVAPGVVEFQDTGSNTVSLQSPTTITGSYTLKLPTAQGGTSTVLSNDGAGNLSWATALTSALTSAHIFVGNGSNVATDTAVTGDVSITNTGVTSISSGLATHFVTREVPSGTINGSNTTFTLANTPVSGTECVYLNGLLQQSGAGNDYTISGATITYLTAPQTGDRLLVNYQK